MVKKGWLDAVGVQPFQKFFHDLVHLGDEGRQLKGAAAGGALHVGFVAGAADVQFLAAFGAF